MTIVWGFVPCRLALLVLGVCLFAFNLTAPAIGQQVRACNPNAGGDLENGQKDVLSRSGKFDYARKQYTFEALSLWGFDPPTSDKTCLRYEIKNNSGLKLEAVSWPDIGMEFVDIAVADRSHWTRQVIPPHPAIQDMSQIKAFASSSDLIRAYLPAVTKHAAGFSEFNVADSMPEAVRTLDAANLPIRPVTAIGPDALPNKTLTSEFSNRTLAFQYVSSVVREGSTISVTQYIKFMRMQSSETEISTPYLMALDNLKTPPNAEEVTRFALMIKEMKNQWQRIAGDGKTVTAPIGSSPALFIVSHPVTVRTKDEIFCLSIKSYSVLPVEAGSNYCGSRQ
jgi:hypothetical protein